MERIFWVACPNCDGRFYCNHDQLRHSTHRLFCPFCRARFLPDEAKALEEKAHDS